MLSYKKVLRMELKYDKEIIYISYLYMYYIYYII